MTSLRIDKAVLLKARSVQMDALSIRVECAIRAIARGYVNRPHEVYTILAANANSGGGDSSWTINLDGRLFEHLKEQLDAHGKTPAWFVRSCLYYLGKKPLNQYFRRYV